MWIEVKTKTGVLSNHQLMFKTEIERHGGRAIVAKCVEDVKTIAEEVK